MYHFCTILVKLQNLKSNHHRSGTIRSVLCLRVFYLCISSLFYSFPIWIQELSLFIGIKKTTTNKKQTVIAFCSLCRKLGKSILHGAQNPVICVVVLFISTEPTDIREKIYEGVRFKLVPSGCVSEACHLNSLDCCHLSFLSVK